MGLTSFLVKPSGQTLQVLARHRVFWECDLGLGPLMKGAGAKGQGRDRRVLSGLESWQRLCVASSSLLSTKRYLEGSV